MAVIDGGAYVIAAAPSHRDVARTLSDNGPARASAIAQHIDRPRTTTSSALRRLCAEGLVQAHGERGGSAAVIYRLTAEGRDAVAALDAVERRLGGTP